MGNRKHGPKQGTRARYEKSHPGARFRGSLGLNGMEHAALVTAAALRVQQDRGGDRGMGRDFWVEFHAKVESIRVSPVHDMG